MSMEEERGCAIVPFEVSEHLTSAMVKAEIDSQVATARQFPRSIGAFKAKLETYATEDVSIAKQCFYVLPRGGKSIEGPSVRLAELALSAYGNAVAQAAVSHIDDKYIYAVGMCRDLESNIAFRMEVKRRITKRDGSRYDDDMIGVAGNAACAIALRNVILKVVPAAYIQPVYEKCRQVAVGDARTMATTRSIAIEYLGKMGVTPDRILASLQRKAIDDIDREDIIKLQGIANAIKDGDTSVDEVFPAVATATAAPVKGVNGLKARLKEKTAPEAQEQQKDPQGSDNDFSYYCPECGLKFDKPLASKQGTRCPGCTSLKIQATADMAATK